MYNEDIRARRQAVQARIVSAKLEKGWNPRSKPRVVLAGICLLAIFGVSGTEELAGFAIAGLAVLVLGCLIQGAKSVE